MQLWEVLKLQKMAYVTPDAFFPRGREVWIDFRSEASEELGGIFDCPVQYAEIPAVYAEISNLSHIDAMSVGLGYDLVGYHLTRDKNSFLPVLMGCNET